MTIREDSDNEFIDGIVTPAITDSPLVSIIIPIYHVEAFMDECIESVVSQTYRKTEIILVDDGSPDHCPEKCDAWAAKDQRIKVMHQQNEGLSSARNHGLMKAHGQYVLFVDSDDWIENNLVERALLTMQIERSQVCFFRFRYCDQNGKKIQPSRQLQWFPSKTGAEASESLQYIIDDHLPSYSWSFIALRELYVSNAILFPVGRLMEDVATTYKIIGSSRRSAFLNEVLYNYRIRQGSVLTSSNSILAFDELENFKEMSIYIDTNYPELSAYVRNASIWNSARGLRKLLKYKISGQISLDQYLKDVRKIRNAISMSRAELHGSPLDARNRLIIILLSFHLSAVTGLYTYLYQYFHGELRPR
ncbi:glycosyltransferase [Bifidobacterium mongoliense]|uniref:glycosyltransferase n=1 Tax=Bifidobacterium mongoliense TaxID=518643 RepID=UPI0030EB2B43